jgi:hypothetical protein
MSEDQATQRRRIPTQYDDHGEPFWRSMTSPSDIPHGICSMVPDRVIPVIFVPGIMGSNLKSTQRNGPRWNMDSSSSMLSWATKDATYRKQHLRPNEMQVDPSGKISDATRQKTSHLRNRGWGEVGYLSYGTFLPWLENALNDYDDAHLHQGVRDQLIGKVLGAAKGEEALTRDEVALSYRYRFPVWACGYNWLDDNAVAAQLLQKRIRQAIEHYTQRKLKCEKVIVVTHSMGGLVARHCSEVLGESRNIFGIVHGVMPAIGAAAVYRRAKSGPHSSGGIKGWITNEVLGANGAEMTAVLSTSPGAMQLLPTPEYGRAWLRVQINGQDIRLPKGDDPYGDIYTVRGKWWSLCDENLMDPLNDAPKGSKQYQSTMTRDWGNYRRMIKQRVQPFQQSLTDKYHPTTYTFYADGKDHLAYGNVTWRGEDAWGERWLSGGRQSDPLDAHEVGSDQVGTTRTVAAPLEGSGWKTGVQQTYTISDPDEPGDGTVPERSGVAPKRFSRAVLAVDTDHEAAFRACEPARLFTVRSIVKIAQAVQTTALAYP